MKFYLRSTVFVFAVIASSLFGADASSETQEVSEQHAKVRLGDAIECGNVLAVKAFIEKYPQLLDSHPSRHCSACTPLYEAICRRNISHDHLAIAEFLLSSGARTDMRLETTQQTPLMMVSDGEEFVRAINFGGAPSEEDTKYIANRARAVALLLHYGAEPQTEALCAAIKTAREAAEKANEADDEFARYEVGIIRKGIRSTLIPSTLPANRLSSKFYHSCARTHESIARMLIAQGLSLDVRLSEPYYSSDAQRQIETVGDEMYTPQLKRVKEEGLKKIRDFGTLEQRCTAVQSVLSLATKIPTPVSAIVQQYVPREGLWGVHHACSITPWE